MSTEWKDGVFVDAKTYKTKNPNAAAIGKIFMADFNANTIEIEINLVGIPGIFWRGTSQEFASIWEPID